MLGRLRATRLLSRPLGCPCTSGPGVGRGRPRTGAGAGPGRPSGKTRTSPGRRRLPEASPRRAPGQTAGVLHLAPARAAAVVGRRTRRGTGLRRRKLPLKSSSEDTRTRTRSMRRYRWRGGRRARPGRGSGSLPRPRRPSLRLLLLLLLLLLTMPPRTLCQAGKPAHSPQSEQSPPAARGAAGLTLPWGMARQRRAPGRCPTLLAHRRGRCRARRRSGRSRAGRGGAGAAAAAVPLWRRC